MTDCALVLSGGGARGAYQAGVLTAIEEITRRHRMPQPFRVICGISAGSLNGTFLALRIDDFRAGARRLVELWSGLQTGHVFRTDRASLGTNALRWLGQASLGAAFDRHPARSLLDTSPLRKLIVRELSQGSIAAQIDAGRLRAVSVSATDYDSGFGVTFVQGTPETVLWRRFRRASEATTLRADHLMASSAIPLLFPPTKIDQRWYGDGGTRNTAPLSPAVRLGADRLVVVGVRPPRGPEAYAPGIPSEEPGIAKVLSTVINGILMDAVDVDVERLSRINRTLSLVPPERRGETPLRRIRFEWLHPSQDLGEIAGRWASKMPRPVRYLLESLGPRVDSQDLISYLLFEGAYARELIELGRADTLGRADEVAALLEPPTPSSAPPAPDHEPRTPSWRWQWPKP